MPYDGSTFEATRRCPEIFICTIKCIRRYNSADFAISTDDDGSFRRCSSIRFACCPPKADKFETENDCTE